MLKHTREEIRKKNVDRIKEIEKNKIKEILVKIKDYFGILENRIHSNSNSTNKNHSFGK